MLNLRLVPLNGQLLLFLLLATSTQCRPDSSTAQQLTTVGQLSDTVSVTSFSFEREAGALTDWVSFEDGGELISLPAGWKSHVVGQELVVRPPASTDSVERVTFARWGNDDLTIENEVFARQLAATAFSTFRDIKGDTLKKLVFAHDFGIERNTSFLVQGKSYTGYCLAYVNDSCSYRFRVILSDKRLHAYQGNLLQDIIGNIQIDQQYFLRKDNPLKQIIMLH